MSASASAAWTQPLRTELPPWLGTAAVARMGTLQALVAAALARAFAWHGQRERQRPERQCGQLLARVPEERANRGFLRLDIALGTLAREWRARSRPLDPINSGSTLLDAKQGSAIADALRDHGVDGVELQARDRGPEVPPDALATRFAAFMQSSCTRDRSGGAGLGLIICRKVMSAHVGRIVARDASDGGAIFCLQLPVPAALPVSDIDLLSLERVEEIT